MRDNNKLLQNVNIFYKLALYADRTIFLKSLSQESAFPSNFPNETLSNLLNELGGRMNVLATEWEKIDSRSSTETNNLKDYAKSFEKASIPSYSTGKEELNEKSSNINHWASIVQTIVAKAPKQLVNYIKTVQDALTKLQEATGTNSSPSIQSQDVKPQSTKLPSIPSNIQTMLNNILGVHDGAMLPISEDGVLGPQTQKAIELFKTKYNVPGNFDLPEVFEVIKNTAARLAQ